MSLMLGTGLGVVMRQSLNPIYSQIPNWATASRNVKNGTATARGLNIGDSTTIGITGAGVGIRPNEYKAVATQLMPTFESAHDDAFFGFSNASGNRLTQDNRLTNSGAALSTVGVLGGVACRLAATGNRLTFTPESTCDRFRVYFWYNGSLTYSIQATGGTALTGTLTSGSGTVFGTSTIRYFEVSAATLQAGNSVTITRTGGAGTGLEIMGLEAWDSTKKQVIMCNVGVWGSKSADWIVSDGTGRKALDLINTMPAGYFTFATVKAGINDAGSAIAVSTYKSNLQTLINAIKAKGMDCILETDNPVQANNMAAYITALKELAASNNLLLINSYDAWGTYTYANAQGWMADTSHPSAAGYTNMATYLSSKLLSV